MIAEDAVYSALAGAPGVTSLVGTRIYPDVRAQDSADPGIRFERLETDPIMTISGPTGSALVTVQVDAYAVTKGAAQAIIAAVYAAFGNTVERLNRAGGYDPDTKLFTESVQVRLIEVE